MKRKITDHPYKPCYYEGKPIKYIKGFCLNPSGPDTCHIKDCSFLESDHELRSNQETDKTSK